MNNFPNTEYQRTGKEIPLNVSVLINFVHNKLDEYAFLKESTQSEPNFNPYTNPVIFTTDEGKLVQVPAESTSSRVSIPWSRCAGNRGRLQGTGYRGQVIGYRGQG